MDQDIMNRNIEDLEQRKFGKNANGDYFVRTTQYDANGNEVSRSFNQDNYFSGFLLNGGSNDMAVNGSSVPVEFTHTVATGNKLKLTRSFVTIEDGVSAFLPSNFGGLSALTNGVEISITPNGGSKVILENWKTNREVRNTMFDFDTQFKTSGAYIGRWTFGKDLGDSGFLLSAGDVFTIKIQDNLSGLDHFSFRIKGTTEAV